MTTLALAFPTTIHGWAVVGWMVAVALVAMVAIVLIVDKKSTPSKP